SSPTRTEGGDRNWVVYQPGGAAVMWRDGVLALKSASVADARVAHEDARARLGRGHDVVARPDGATRIGLVVAVAPQLDRSGLTRAVDGDGPAPGLTAVSTDAAGTGGLVLAPRGGPRVVGRASLGRDARWRGCDPIGVEISRSP